MTRPDRPAFAVVRRRRTHSSARDRSDCGFALITVVLLMIGLAVLATGLVFSAAQQAALTGSTHDIARARRAAEAAVGAALAGWNAGQRSLDPIGTEQPLVARVLLDDGVTMHARSRRLASEIFLVTGTGVAALTGTEPITQSATRIVRSLDVDSVGRALDAALVSGSARIGPGSIVAGASAAHSLPGDATAASLCAEWLGAASALRAPGDSVQVAASAVVAGSPPIAPDDDARRTLRGLGFLDVGTLAARAREVAVPSLTPGPVVAGVACDTVAHGSWGAPDGPCSAHLPALHATESLTLEGGYGQGILIVDRDLVLDGGVRWRGLLIVLGTITIRDARVDGVVLSGGVRLEGGAAYLDRCALAATLAGAAATRRPDLPIRSWIPSFD